MRLRYRMTLAIGFVGAVAVAAAAFGQTGTPSPSGTDAAKAKGGRGHKLGHRNLVHSESKVQVEGGFALVIVDHGTVTSVSGNRVTIERADGESVTVAVGDDTKVRRNAEEASVSALKTGDRAQIVQVDRDGTRTVRAIRAFSEDFKPQDRPRRGRGRHRPGPPAQRPEEAEANPAVFAV